MRLDRDPNRSRSPSLPPNDEENNNNDVEDEAELETSMIEKEAELRHTQELLDDRKRQFEQTLAQLVYVKRLLEQSENREHGDVNKKN